jgi:hypothetical protein
VTIGLYGRLKRASTTGRIGISQKFLDAFHHPDWHDHCTVRQPPLWPVHPKLRFDDMHNRLVSAIRTFVHPAEQDVDNFLGRIGHLDTAAARFRIHDLSLIMFNAMMEGLSTPGIYQQRSAICVPDRAGRIQRKQLDESQKLPTNWEGNR